MNSFGRVFRISIFGESHGESVGVIIDGCPPGIKLQTGDFFKDMKRRKPGVSGTTERKESDIPLIKSGLFKGATTGSPIMIEFINENIQTVDYEHFKIVPRPGQTDFIAAKKFNGFNDYRGGGHFSARLTAGLVASGVIAKKILKGIDIKAEVLEISGCKKYNNKIKEAIEEKDSLGGIIECSVDNLPAGLGEPFFDSVESVISQVVFSIPSVKGIEFGAGFLSAKLRGSEYNDPIINVEGYTLSNNCGGITGGLSNGNQIIFRAAFRPPSSILRPQKSINLDTGNVEELSVSGRHDICPVLRAPVIVEAVTAIALCDLFILNRRYKK